MSKQHTDGTYLCGLDLGTSKVRAIIARLNQDGLPEILGHGSATNTGYRKGVPIDVPETARAIDEALAQCERMSGVEIHAAAVSINGSHIKTQTTHGVIAVKGDNIIDQGEIDRVQQAASIITLPPNEQLLELVPQVYTIDGRDKTDQPEGMQGARLELDALLLSISSPAYRNVQKILELARIEERNNQMPARAAAEAILTKSQKESGVAVLDIGAQTTGLAIYEEGSLKHVAVIPIGSANITNDLAIGLRIELELAEMVKKELCSALKTPGKMRDKMSIIEVEYAKQVHTFQARDVDLIVSSRVEEIFSKVAREIKACGKEGSLASGVVLCGDGANMRDITQAAVKYLQLPARVANLSSYKVVSGAKMGPEWAAALGLLIIDELQVTGGLDKGVKSKKSTSSLQSILKRFKK